MGGLLHRLAMRALGGERQVHSAQRVPFAAAAPEPEAAVAHGSPAAPATESNDGSAPVATAAVDAATPPARVVAVESSPVAAVRTPSEVRAAQRSQADLDNNDASPGAVRAQGHHGETPPALSLSARLVAGPQRQERASGTVPQPTQPSSTALATNEVPTLLPPSPPLRRTFQTAVGRAATPRDSAPGDIHVTIGRIEVTAVPAPTPHKRNPVRPRQAMTLADYLARRKGTAS